jgi:hypothetical protein
LVSKTYQHDILGFDVGIKFGIATMTDADKKYDFVTPDYLDIKNPLGGTFRLVAGTDYDAKVTGVPTVVGEDKEYSVRMKQTTANTLLYNYYKTQNSGSDVLFPIPKGLNLPAVPLPMPQAALGLPFGIELMVRFVPTISAGTAGKFNYSGFGLRYDIDQWLPLFPVDIAVHFMTQKMNFKSTDDKDVFSASGTAYGLEVSKKLFILTLYGGFQLEKATFTLGAINGKFTAGDGTVTPFTIPETTFDGKNSSRVTFGLRLLLLFINAHVEYSLAKTPVIAAGVGISIR